MKLSDLKDALIIWGVLSQEALDKIKSRNSLVIIPENRPYLFGLLYNIPILKQNKIKFVYCTDNMIGLLFYKKKIKKTLIFYKKLTEEGVLGISGSLYVALLSKIHNVAIEIYPQGSSNIEIFDYDASTLAGRNLIITEDKNAFEVPEDEILEWRILK